jgi:hypothetical protein
MCFQRCLQLSNVAIFKVFFKQNAQLKNQTSYAKSEGQALDLEEQAFSIVCALGKE